MTEDIKARLDELAARYNCAAFVENDPISIPHMFTLEQDIEIAAFLASTVAWGQRVSILRSARRMVERMDMSPYDFLMSATERDIDIACKGFVHRTFNEADFAYFLGSLARIYRHDGGLRDFFEQRYVSNGDLRVALREFYDLFFANGALARTTRHMSNIAKGSACKRLNMFLRWMVRRDDNGVDFGLWRKIDPAALYIPLDVHAARQGRNLGLLTRTANDWRAVEELTGELRKADPFDPVKYDFALFGVGVNN